MSALVALFLVLHGGVHIGFVCSRSWPFERGGPWLAALSAGTPELSGLGTILALVAFAGFLAAGLAAVGLLPARTWRPLVVVAAMASMALLVLFATPATVPGIAIDAVLLYAVLGRNWRPTPLVGRGRSRRPLAQ